METHYFGIPQIKNIADRIEKDFINDGKYIVTQQSYSQSGCSFSKKEKDYLEGASANDKDLILQEVRSLIDDLRKNSQRIKILDYLINGDTTPESYLKRLSEIK